MFKIERDERRRLLLLTVQAGEKESLQDSGCEGRFMFCCCICFYLRVLGNGGFCVC